MTLSFPEEEVDKAGSEARVMYAIITPGRRSPADHQEFEDPRNRILEIMHGGLRQYERTCDCHT